MNSWFYLASFILAFILSFFLTIIVRKIAVRYNLYDLPDQKRHLHKKPTPRLGGIALFLAFLVTALIIMPFSKYLAGLIFGSFILLVVGLIDDLKRLPALIKLSAQIFAALVIIICGAGINFVTNPFGGFIFLDQIKIPIKLDSVYHFVIPADIITIIWIVAIVNITNFLDGLDGLASGVGIISALMIFVLSILPSVNQPLSAIIAIILLGALLGFLPFNFFPAKIFLGDSGSMFLGFCLSVLAVISGAKFATVLLVLGLPIFDGFWVVGKRIILGRHPFAPGRDHLHHKLLDLGLDQKIVVLIFYFITILFGLAALFSGSKAKFFWLLALAFLLSGLMIILEIVFARKKKII